MDNPPSAHTPVVRSDAGRLRGGCIKGRSPQSSVPLCLLRDPGRGRVAPFLSEPAPARETRQRGIGGRDAQAAVAAKRSGAAGTAVGADGSIDKPRWQLSKRLDVRPQMTSDHGYCSGSAELSSGDLRWTTASSDQDSTDLPRSTPLPFSDDSKPKSRYKAVTHYLASLRHIAQLPGQIQNPRLGLQNFLLLSSHLTLPPQHWGHLITGVYECQIKS